MIFVSINVYSVKNIILPLISIQKPVNALGFIFERIFSVSEAICASFLQ